jgi:hypothetical protein
MKKHLIVAAGVLLTLGTAFAATAVRTAGSAVIAPAVDSDTSAQATEQVLSMWQSHAKPPTSTHLARPL